MFVIKIKIEFFNALVRAGTIPEIIVHDPNNFYIMCWIIPKRALLGSARELL